MSKQSDNVDTSGFDPSQPFALPRLPPPAELDSKPILRRCISAHALLGELRQAVNALPNQEILLSTLPVLEAQASTEIENIVTTNDAIFRELDRTSVRDSATKEALRYRKALLSGFDELKRRPLTTGTAEQICSTLLGLEVQVRSVPGTTLQDGRGGVIYTPPVGQDQLRNLLGNWEAFLHDTRPTSKTTESVDPLVRMAVGHYQFEAIHPFLDGNGRTGRILNSLYLVQTNLLQLPILYLSRPIIQRKDEYYGGLLQVTQHGAWEPWILFMLEIVEEATNQTLNKIEALTKLMETTAIAVRTNLPKIYSYELVQLLFERPYCRISDVVNRGIAERQTASKYLRLLTEAGVLETEKKGREQLFIHRELLKRLTN